jgi:uncharacterized protein YggU (UPF0235/DUF167 family)
MIRITITVHPGASRRGVQVRDDGLHVYTQVKPIEGKANRDARELLAEFFHIPRSHISLFKGDRSRSKIFQIKETWEKVRSGLERQEASIIHNNIREV